MPAPERTTLDAIVTAACELLEADGLAGLTMQAVAGRVGVRAPSLYKRVDGRDHLIQLVAEATITDFVRRVDAAAGPREMMDAFRAFGHERPAAFQLVMMPGAGTPRVREQYVVAATAPILRTAAELAGEQRALEAARTLTAWAAGFIGMELFGGFNLGGDVDAAWDFGVTAILAAVARAG